MQALQVLSQQEHTLTKPAIVLRDLWKGLEVARKYSDWADDQLEIYTQSVDFIEVHLNVNPTNHLPI